MLYAFVGLGSNLGDPPRKLAAARAALAALPGLTIAKASPLYRTEPQGLREQNWFYNQVLQLACAPDWTARSLLEKLLQLETSLGRMREEVKQFGPRHIDLDLLLFGNEQYAEKKLYLPHPRMHERAFVLVPLYAIAPELVLPNGRTLASCLSALSYNLCGDCIYQ